MRPGIQCPALIGGSVHSSTSVRGRDALAQLRSYSAAARSCSVETASRAVATRFVSSPSSAIVASTSSSENGSSETTRGSERSRFAARATIS
ncbi:MAG TPA: hypothetical protein VGX91_07545 [Candidatus Cybelea sp.]|nr:hypothetical protein [Candidatus Cybelea sp.]